MGLSRRALARDGVTGVELSTCVLGVLCSGLLCRGLPRRVAFSCIGWPKRPCDPPLRTTSVESETWLCLPLVDWGRADGPTEEDVRDAGRPDLPVSIGARRNFGRDRGVLAQRFESEHSGFTRELHAGASTWVGHPGR
jgi:hypothetical protein